MEEISQKPTSKKSIKKRLLFVSIFFVFLVIIGIVITMMPKPAGPPVASMPDQVLRGTIESADYKSLVLKSDSSSYTLSIENTDDFEWVSSGSFDEGNAIFAKVNRLYLRAGQEAVVTVKGGSSGVTKVVLLTR